MAKTVAVPNEIIRSSLFSAKFLKASRPSVVKEIVSWHKDTKMSISGEEFNQYDCLVFYSCLYEMQKHGKKIGERIDVRTGDLMENIGLTTSTCGARIKAFRESLERMRRTTVSINKEGISYEGSLLSVVGKGRRGVMFCVNEVFVDILSSESRTFIDIEKKRRISSFMGRWIHDFLSSHSGLYQDLTFDRIGELCGSAADRSEIRRLCRKGVERLLAECPELSQKFVGTKTGISQALGGNHLLDSKDGAKDGAKKEHNPSNCRW